MADEDIEMNSKIQIFVRIMAGRQYKTYPLIVNNNALVQEIANLLSSKTGVDSKLIILSYRSRMLYRHESLSKHNIGSESTINAAARCDSDSNHNALSSASFPPGHELKDELHSINHKISRLQARCMRGLNAPQSRSRSLSAFLAIWNNISVQFAHEYKVLIEKKLSLSKAIDNNCKEQLYSMKHEIKLVKIDMAQMDENVKEIDDTIRKYKRLIDELNVKKAQQLSRKETRKQEIITRKQSLVDFKTIKEDTAADIVAIQKEIESDSSVMLVDCCNGMLRKYEQQHENWDNKDVIAWLKMIEDGQFNRNVVIDGIRNLEINGDSLKDLRNESILKMCRLNSVERRCLFKNIDRVLNKPVDKSNICTVCVQNEIDSAFVPCGHQSVCYECYQKERRRFRNCPICRKHVANTMKTFMNGF